MVQFDFANIRQNYRKWWKDELGRPLIAVEFRDKPTGFTAPSAPPLRFPTAYDENYSPKQMIERVDYDLNCREYAFEGYPAVSMDCFGPGVLAAFLGAKVHPAEHTVWFEADKVLPISELHFEYRDDSPALERVKQFYFEGSKLWGGNVLMTMVDLGGILDVLASFRGTENLLTDLIEYPEEVSRCVNELQALWFRYFNELNAIIAPTAPGYSHWAKIYDEQPSYILQSDFSYMIGPERFREFVAPELASSASRLHNCCYHLDGMGELPMLDNLLEIDAIKLIQWVPGSGEPSERDWTEVYRRITDKKKLYYIFGNPQNLKYICGVVRKPDSVFTQMGFDYSQKDEVMKQLNGFFETL